jgi:hypothetical protein
MHLPTDPAGSLKVVREADDSAFLRQTFVHRTGHCASTPAETIAAVQALLRRSSGAPQALPRRMDTGDWSGLDANSLNAAAAATGPAFNVFGASPGIVVSTPPAYFEFAPSPYLRPFDALSSQCQSDPCLPLPLRLTRLRYLTGAMGTSEIQQQATSKAFPARLSLRATTAPCRGKMLL